MDVEPHHLSPTTTPPSQNPSSSPNTIISPYFQQPYKSTTPGGLNTVLIVSAMLCALVCALGLHSLLQCVVTCTRRAVTEPVEWVTSLRMSSGLKKKDMVALPTSTYVKSGCSSPASASHQCAICLVDYLEGDGIRVLPKCSHRFHVACIDTWLAANSSCPTCRHRLKAHGSMTPLQIVSAI